MDQEKLEHFRELLQSKMDELLAEAGRTVAGMTDAKESFPIPPIGPPWRPTATFFCVYATVSAS